MYGRYWFKNIPDLLHVKGNSVQYCCLCKCNSYCNTWGDKRTNMESNHHPWIFQLLVLVFSFMCGAHKICLKASLYKNNVTPPYLKVKALKHSLNIHSFYIVKSMLITLSKRKLHSAQKNFKYYTQSSWSF